MNKAERSAKADTAFKVLYKIQNLMKIQRFCEDTIHDWDVGYRSTFQLFDRNKDGFITREEFVKVLSIFSHFTPTPTFNRYNRNRKKQELVSI